ncbi:uncharacterized protein LOC106053023 isoform X2 [Biomphalaria glabrata]|uniref:Uncharacterized protein LOC106053023 isoform X2 n=1 Tax=Biomphalaria glabrata TaxID=6526 RepID=A0A9W2Z5J8_BIOGL|nr:uncharacterized protein LOC106053023 isoform X2 [Biomphalaria glabrata]
MATMSRLQKRVYCKSYKVRLNFIHELIMLLLNVCVSLTLIGLANALCAETSWWHSFDSAGQSKCDEANYYIKGLKRNDLLNDDQIFLLEGVLCCSAPSQWSNSELQVVYADWTRKWDRSEEWAYCPQGFFLQGMQRSTTGWPWYAGYLQNIENGRCAKPANHPFYYGHCYVEIIEFNSNGMFSCQDDYYITGLYKSDCGYLHCIDKLYCCKMAAGPEVIDNADKVKTKIMETTLFNLANLADKLGYGWCYGTKGVNVGEDFYRSGDSWIADRRLFWPNRWCDGYMCNERLAIDYTGWTLAVKEIIYGESVIDELQPETVHTGVRYNHLNESSSATFEYSRDVTETVEHSTASSWSISVGMSFSLEFQINKLTQASGTFRTAFEYSRSSTNTNSQMRTDTLRTSSTQTIPPRSAARYSVMVGKTRTTIPYTAVIIAKFNVRFRGFLRWGGGFSGSTKNYHYQHKGSGDRPSVPYTFGDQSQPFYTALKRESESQARPWLWNEMTNRYPSVRHEISRLTDESQYQFTLNGKLEHVAGTKIDVIWENARLNRRSVPDESEPSTPYFDNSTFFAKVGPNDKPVDVKYPEVVLVNAEPFIPETFPVKPESN